MTDKYKDWKVQFESLFYEVYGFTPTDANIEEYDLLELYNMGVDPVDAVDKVQGLNML